MRRLGFYVGEVTVLGILFFAPKFWKMTAVIPAACAIVSEGFR